MKAYFLCLLGHEGEQTCRHASTQFGQTNLIGYRAILYQYCNIEIEIIEKTTQIRDSYSDTTR